MARKIKHNRVVLMATFRNNSVHGRIEYILTCDDSQGGDLDATRSRSFVPTVGQAAQLTLIKDQVLADVSELEDAEIEP